MQFLEQLIGPQASLVLAFLLAAAVVVLAGIRLSIYGDALGDRTGFGSGLIGLVFLAAVTSLPELVVSLTSVIQNPDLHRGVNLATGNMLGSNVFNLLILALMALFFPRRFAPEKMADPHTASIAYGLVMLVLFAVAFFISGTNTTILPGLQCSGGTLLLPIAYGLILWREHRQQQKGELKLEKDNHLPSEQTLTHLPALRFYSVLSGLCGLIIGGGIILSLLGSRMALAPEQGGFGLDASLIGTLFLAISTSLPELVISFASIRMGLLDMAVGNVLGSNMFNLLILFVADVALRGENLLSHASSKNWTSVGLILLLTLLARLLLRTKTRKRSIAIAAVMVGTYLAALAFFT